MALPSQTCSKRIGRAAHRHWSPSVSPQHRSSPHALALPVCLQPAPPPSLLHIHPPFAFCQVYLATTGEMSGTILAYPNSHYRLIDQLKDVATEGNPTWRDNMQVRQCRPLSQCLTASAGAPLGRRDSPSHGSHAGLHPAPVSS